METYIDPVVAEGAIHTLEDAIIELNTARDHSDSTYTRKELDKLIARMYDLQTFIEYSQP
jgi:hypothetical protein